MSLKIRKRGGAGQQRASHVTGTYTDEGHRKTIYLKWFGPAQYRPQGSESIFGS